MKSCEACSCRSLGDSCRHPFERLIHKALGKMFERGLGYDKATGQLGFISPILLTSITHVILLFDACQRSFSSLLLPVLFSLSSEGRFYNIGAGRRKLCWGPLACWLKIPTSI